MDFSISQFEWMDHAPGDFSSQLTKEFYTSYASTLMKLVAANETTKRGQREFATTVGPLDSIIVRGKSFDILESFINRILHGPDRIAQSSVGLFEWKHYEVANAANMEDQASREKVLQWMANQIAIDGEHARWETTMPIPISNLH